VDRELVVQGYYSKIPTAELRDYGPEPISIVLLALDADWVLNDGDAPFSA